MAEIPFMYLLCQVPVLILSKPRRRRIYKIKGCGTRTALLGHIHEEPYWFDTHNWAVGWWEARIMRK